MGILNPDSGSGERPGPRDIWRTWLVTGAREHPIDSRRLQGPHRGLKQILAEGGESDALRRPWRDFSRAMARQAVNEVMVGLSSRERVVITMAYFAGFSNDEIAEELGMTPRGVQRSLSRALDRLSELLERGKRLALGLVLSLTGGRLARWLSDTATPAVSHSVAVMAVVVAVAAAPAAGAGAASDRHQPTGTSGRGAVAQPAASVAPATTSQAATPAQPAPAPAVAPSVSAPAVTVTSPVAVPQLPPVKLPKVTVPKVL